MVAIFSLSYIETEKIKKRFTILITVFVLSIIILIYISNIFSIIIGWDGLGLSSFCLVIFFQNKESIKSGLITIFTNRLGDCLIVVTLIIIITIKMIKINNEWFTIIIIIITVGAFTKRAQIPFSAWLPAAIAAPTPVSSLVHSSTLVTAGTFLISRFKVLTKRTIVTKIVIVSSIITSITAGLTAWKEIDAKKIVAMSTLRQLGLITFSLSINYWKLCLFHIITHAIFKALLFINTGYNINNNFGKQEKRNINFPKVSITISNIASILSLTGIPFIAGFYSKDIILEKIITKEINLVITLSFIVACVLTSVYSIILFRFIYKKIQIKTTNERKKDKRINQSSKIIIRASIIIGPITSNIIIIQTPKVRQTYKLVGPTIIIVGFLALKLKEKKEESKKINSMVFTNKISYSPLSMVIFKKRNYSKKRTLNIIDRPKILINRWTNNLSKKIWKITKTDIKKIITLIILITIITKI